MRMRLLVVDDDRIEREALASVLTGWGHEVKTAEDGLAALAILETFSAGVILTDLRMPRMDGTAAIYAPAPAGLEISDYDRRWVASHGGTAMTDQEASAKLDREVSFDSDIWIVEVGDREGRHFLGDDLAG